MLAYYREGTHAQERPALMWDFCAVPQHDPITGAKRSDAQTATFKAGLDVMSNAYASPRVLVLQHRRIPPALEAELHAYGGRPPAERLDLIPYAGAHCRSGWCTSESACVLLMTAGGTAAKAPTLVVCTLSAMHADRRASACLRLAGGHAYELGVGKVPVEPGQLPSVEAMEALFRHESTRFLGKADREVVSSGYLELRRKLESYDKEHVPGLVRPRTRAHRKPGDAPGLVAAGTH